MLKKTVDTVIVGKDEEGRNIYNEVYENEKGKKYIVFFSFIGGDGLKRAADIVMNG
jgi:hypothetical protein